MSAIHRPGERLSELHAWQLAFGQLFLAWHREHQHAPAEWFHCTACSISRRLPRPTSQIPAAGVAPAPLEVSSQRSREYHEDIVPTGRALHGGIQDERGGAA